MSRWFSQATHATVEMRRFRVKDPGHSETIYPTTNATSVVARVGRYSKVRLPFARTRYISWLEVTFMDEPGSPNEMSNWRSGSVYTFYTVYNPKACLDVVWGYQPNPKTLSVSDEVGGFGPFRISVVHECVL